MKPNIGQGDSGKTHLAFGSREKEKVPKDDSRIEACGMLDELVSQIGIVRSLNGRKALDKLLERIQDHLFRIEAHICILPGKENHPTLPCLGEEQVSFLENAIREYENGLPELKNFIYPGSTKNKLEAQLHKARAKTRTVERRLVTASNSVRLHPHAIPYINRLSDLFFIFARWINHKNKRRATKWIGRQKRGL